MCALRANTDPRAISSQSPGSAGLNVPYVALQVAALQRCNAARLLMKLTSTAACVLDRPPLLTFVTAMGRVHTSLPRRRARAQALVRRHVTSSGHQRHVRHAKEPTPSQAGLLTARLLSASSGSDMKAITMTITTTTTMMSTMTRHHVLSRRSRLQSRHRSRRQSYHRTRQLPQKARRSPSPRPR